MTVATWHVLQQSGPIDDEFACALAEFLPVVLWKPRRQLLPSFRTPQQPTTRPPGASLRTQEFPALRGLSRLPAGWSGRVGRGLAGRLMRTSEAPGDSVLVCTTSLFAGVADAWTGPVVFWLTDLMARYESLSRQRVTALDRQLCKRATLVCPNSERLAAYLRDEAGCPPGKIQVIPNAARMESLLEEPQLKPVDLPAAHAALKRPITGVIGNLADNTDWVFLQRTMELAPWMSWLFVGPTETAIRDPAQATARLQVMQSSQARFTGSQPHSELFRYARALDVAVLPYRHREPTYSGSSTRFYEHLAACHPMLATAGVAELQSKEPLLKLVNSPQEAATALQALRETNFDDGLRTLRWQASHLNTWRNRALQVQQALHAQLLLQTAP